MATYPARRKEVPLLAFKRYWYQSEVSALSQHLRVPSSSNFRPSP